MIHSIKKESKMLSFILYIVLGIFILGFILYVIFLFMYRSAEKEADRLREEDRRKY